MQAEEPGVGANVPISHALHAVLSMVADDEPAGHGAHTPFSNAEPTGHEADPVHAGLVTPAAHSVQELEPGVL